MRNNPGRGQRRAIAALGGSRRRRRAPPAGVDLSLRASGACGSLNQGRSSSCESRSEARNRAGAFALDQRLGHPTLGEPLLA